MRRSRESSNSPGRRKHLLGFGGQFATASYQPSAGFRPKVRPVVLYSGWYVERQPAGVEVWVLNLKAFGDFLGYERPILREDQVRSLAAALDNYVRTYEGAAR